jgi:hypothetical protein
METGGGFEGWARCVMASSPAYYERKEVHDGYQGSNMQFRDYGYAVLEVTDVRYFHITLNQRNCTYEPYLQEISVKNALSLVPDDIKCKDFKCLTS